MRRRRSSGMSRSFIIMVILAVGFAAFYTMRRAQRGALQREGDSTASSSGAGSRAKERGDSDDGPKVYDLDRSSSSSAPIQVFFSDTYANDPVIPKRDADNIDRHLATFIGTAKRTLDCAFFELQSQRIADALIAAKKRGVRVRLVADSDYKGNLEMQSVVAAGIPVVFDNRSALMHNKFAVVDRAAIWSGSFNATDNCAFRNNNNGVMIASRDLADNYSAEFAEMFERREFGASSTANTPHPMVNAGGAEIYNYFSPEDNVPPKIVKFLRGAHASIHFMAFSFTDASIGGALVDASHRGVKVEGVVEQRGSDSKEAQLRPLTAAGIPVLTDGNKYSMHHKVFVIDTLWTITGSYNFTSNGARANDENLLIIKSRDVARKFEAEYARIKKMAGRAM